MELRPYQREASEAIFREWDTGRKRTLLVMPTGSGKTRVFCSVSEEVVRRGGRVLILAHRGELLDQAADKMHKATGLACALEKAESTCLGEWERITVGSVQTLMRPQRLRRFAADYFRTVIVDEAHHALSATYQRVLSHFAEAAVLGVTATPDRGDKQSLGQYFESLAYEYTLPAAVRDGYLCKIVAKTIPLQIDLAGVKQQNGDYQVAGLATALDPYLEQIADEMVQHKDRKIVVFLPLIATAKKFTHMLRCRGLEATEINGESKDRAEILERFDRQAGGILCNAMLLCLDKQTEVLTNRGFVTHDSIQPDDEVANWNLDGSVFFEKPLEIVRRPLSTSEYMVSVDSRTINLRVTNTHRMVVSCGLNGSEWKKISAQGLRSGHMLPTCGVAEPFNYQIPRVKYPEIAKQDISRTSHYLQKTGQCTDVETSRDEAVRRKQERQLLQYTQPRDLTLDDCRLIGFWIADGTKTNLQSGGVEYVLCQSPRYSHIVKWIDQLLQRIGIHHIRKTKTKAPEAVLWSLPRGTGSGSQKRNGLFRLEPYLRKSGSLLFWGLNETQFDALVEGYWYGDGFHGQAEHGMPRSIYMTDTNKEWIDLLCSIGPVRGWRCNMLARPQKNVKHKDQWGLRMIKGMPLHVSHKTNVCHETYQAEDVWCVRTTSKNIITRRNGVVTVMGNTEGWDCPSVDCICVLRPTRIRSLYCQMVGRGTRIHPGKENLLILDFLWHTSNHELCRPANLLCETQEAAAKMTDMLADAAGTEMDLVELEQQAESNVVADREEALAKKLKELRSKRAKLVDPLQYEMSIGAEDLVDYQPAFGWEMAPASDSQLDALEKSGVFAGEIANAGKASLLLDRLQKRRQAGLASPKQIRLLERMGFRQVGQWTFDGASRMISRISAAGWRTPFGVDPATFQPQNNTEVLA